MLFWIGLAFMVVTTMLRNIRDTGLPLRHQMWDIMVVKTWQLGLSDGAMVFSTALAVPFHQMVQCGRLLAWKRMGMPVFAIFQISWLLLWVK